MEKLKLQVQSVLYANEKRSIRKTIEYLANAVRVERSINGSLGEVKLIYGDATAEPIFTEAEIEEFRREFGEYLQIEYRVFGYNTGTAKGHNLMAEDCCADYVLIMNPDIIMSPRCLIEMLAPFGEERVGMVEARQSPLEHPKEYDIQTKETEWATTACAVVPLSVFREVGGFDSDTFFLYCDDVDFSWRVRLQGYRILYQPLAVVYHAKRLDSQGRWEPTPAEVYYSAEAALLMAHKWSNHKQVQQLLRIFGAASDEAQQKAAAEYVRRREEGRLPEPIDPEHKVANFVEWHFSPYRFTY